MKAWVRKNTIFFDDEAAKLIKEIAKRNHQSFKTTVLIALRRGVKRARTKNAKAKVE